MSDGEEIMYLYISATMIASMFGAWIGIGLNSLRLRRLSRMICKGKRKWSSTPGL
jgi:hypothetical protein